MSIPENIEINQLLSESTTISELKISSGKNVECLVEIGGLSYPIVWTQSFGSCVVNPNEGVVKDYLAGVLPEENESSAHVLLLPLQANGRCGANCRGCVFARDIVGEALMDRSQNRRIATPTSPDVMRELISTSVLVAESLGIMEPGSKFRLNPLLSGDPAFSHHTKDLIRIVASNPRITASRWSTIATKTTNNPLEEFIEVANEVHHSGNEHKLRLQVSLHSTDEDKRIDHVSYHSHGHRPHLISASEIGNYFNRIKENIGVSSTLAFVVDRDTVISPQELQNNFNQNSTWISLRPIISNPLYQANPMLEADFLRLYGQLRNENWSVVIMPSTEASMEQHNLNANIS